MSAALTCVCVYGPNPFASASAALCVGSTGRCEGGVGHGLGTRENVSEGNTGDFRRQSGAGHARLGAATGTVSPPRDPRHRGFSSSRWGREAGATTDANDRDPPVSPTWTPRHFEPRILPTDICRGMRDRGTRAWDSPFVLYGTDVVHDRRHRARRRRPRARRLANPRSTARVAPRAVRNWPRPFTRARGVRHTRGL